MSRASTSTPESSFLEDGLLSLCTQQAEELVVCTKRTQVIADVSSQTPFDD